MLAKATDIEAIICFCLYVFFLILNCLEHLFMFRVSVSSFLPISSALFYMSARPAGLPWFLREQFNWLHSCFVVYFVRFRSRILSFLFCLNSDEFYHFKTPHRERLVKSDTAIVLIFWAPNPKQSNKNQCVFHLLPSTTQFGKSFVRNCLYVV